jgi:3-oxoacyl-[acyl-carrier protein] reductase
MVISGHEFPSFGVLLASLPGNSRAAGALTLCCQVWPGAQQVGEGREHYQSVVIFLQPPIANFAIAEDSLDGQKRVLDFGSDTGFHPLNLMQQTVLGELGTTSGTHGDFPVDRSALMFLAFLNACVASISPDSFLLTVQQLVRYGNVTDIGGCGSDTVDQAKGLVDTDVHLHPKVPLVSFPGLMHLGVTCIVFVFGRTRRGDNSGIHDGSFLEREPLGSQVLVDGIEDDLAQAALLEEMSKVQDGGFVRDTLRKPQASKAAHGFQLIERVFHGWVTEVVEQLQAVHPQHDRQRVRRAAILPAGIVLAELLLQLGPRNECFHALQEDFAPGFALLVGKLGFGEGHLGHGDILLLGLGLLSQNSGLFQSILRDFGAIHGLVNNAGVLRDSRLVKVRDGRVVGKMSAEEFDLVVDVHMRGSFLCAREAASHMIECGVEDACIMGISSGAFRGNFGQTNYSAAKAGIVAMSRVWSKELAPYNIRSMAIAPGTIETDMLRSMPAEALTKMASQVPLGRIGSVNNIAQSVAFILENNYVSGGVIDVSGGLYL